MSQTKTELADVQRALGQLRSCVGALRSRYGDVAAVRRLTNDIERLDIDISEMSTTMPVPRAASTQETVVVPDTPYDMSLWKDADDEGVGGQSR